VVSCNATGGIEASVIDVGYGRMRLGRRALPERGILLVHSDIGRPGRTCQRVSSPTDDHTAPSKKALRRFSGSVLGKGCSFIATRIPGRGD